MRDLFILLFFYIYFCNVDTFSQCAELAYRGNNGSKDCIELVWNTPPANVNFNITINGQTGTFIYQSGSGTSTSRAQYKRAGSNCNGVIPALPFDNGIMNYQGQTCIYSSGTLPVSFDNLSISKINEHDISIFWQSSSEQNGDYYTIERSEQSLEFQELEYIKSKGGDNLKVDYNYIDYNPVKEILYYRIVQYDYDGIKHIAKTKKFDNRINVSEPEFHIDLENKFLEVEIFEKNPQTVMIYDINGQKLFDKAMIGNKNIDLTHLKSGMYILCFIGQKIKSHKIIMP